MWAAPTGPAVGGEGRTRLRAGCGGTLGPDVGSLSLQGRSIIECRSVGPDWVQNFPVTAWVGVGP